ncbi:hypothetical protein C8F01DRAFT_1116568 [Mycena amicta]|nr:hypothetical protein C8F01DRAFT_1116568 [Mycena amicta]
MPECVVCRKAAKYTCPRCSTPTCSLPCSRTHKTRSQCSGERDKAAYVPMNKYSWGTMMDDYVFLEDLGRKVGDWGSEIARGKFQARGRGRGRPVPAGRSKRDVLKMQLDALDIDMDVLPAGMERHKQNQSVWDSRNGSAQLTIEFVFHPPLASEKAVTLLTHRNNLSTPLLAILRKHVSERKASPEWVKTLVFPDADSPETFTAPQCVMQARMDPRTRAYYRFDAAQNLETLLRHTHFVEYPTVEVWEEFRGRVVDSVGMVTQEAERAPKRRRIDKKAGGLAIAGLLDGYGSSDEEQDEEKPGGLEMLGGYSGDEDDDAVQLDPAALLELVRQARGDENWTPNMEEEDNDDAVDWGDSD